MDKTFVARRALWKGALLLALWLTTAGCAVKFTPLYDDTLDKSVTAFQEKVETYLTKLENESKPACIYSQNLDFYEQASVQLAIMRTRVEASLHHAQLQQIILALTNTLNDLQKLQQASPEACLNSAVLEDTRQAFEREFESMLAYELALKANQPPATAPTRQ